jgi:hypothetical protein
MQSDSQIDTAFSRLSFPRDEGNRAEETFGEQAASLVEEIRHI